MANTIQIKRSSTASNVPTAGELAEGELAINTNPADRKLYSKDSGGTVFEIGGGIADGTVTGSMLKWSGSAWTETDHLEITETGTGGTSEITFSANGTDFLRYNANDGGVVNIDDAPLRIQNDGRLDLWPTGAAARPYLRAATVSSGPWLELSSENNAAMDDTGVLSYYPLRFIAESGNRGKPTNTPAYTVGFYAAQHVATSYPFLMFINDGDRAWPIHNTTEVLYRHRTNNTIADPSAYNFRTDTSSFSTITQMAVHDTSSNDEDSGWFWGMVEVGDTIYVHSDRDYTDWFHAVVDGITDNTGWWTIDVTVINNGTGTNFNDHANCSIGILQKAATGVIGGSITDNQIAVGAATANSIEGSASLTWDGSVLSVTGGVDTTATSDFDGDLYMTTQALVRFYDSTDTNYAHVFHDDTNLSIVGSSTSWAKFTGFSSGTWVSNGGTFRISDVGDAYYADFTVTGNDLNITDGGTGITDINITGIAGFNVVNYSFDVDQTVGAGQDGYVLTYDNGTGLISLEAAAGGSQTPWTSDIDGAGFGLDNIDRLEIQAPGVATDTATFTHDGTDFNTTFANTTEWNIDTQVKFWDGTMTTIGAWHRPSQSRFEVRAGYGFRIYNSDNLDWVTFDHDGTDLNITGTNTADIDIDGITWVNQLAGGGFRVLDSTNTDYHSWYHDGTNVVNTYVGTTNVRHTGASYMDIEGGMNIRVRDAGIIYAYDSTDTDYISMYDVGNIAYIAANNNPIYLRTNSTNVAWCNTDGNFYVGANLLLNTNDDYIYGRTSGGTAYAIFGVNTGNDVLLGNANLGEILCYNPFKQLESANANADSAGYGQWWVKNDAPNTPWFTDDAGNDYPLGFGAYKLQGNASKNMTTASVAEQMVNAIWYKTNTTAYTLTLETSSATNFPVGAQLTIVNAGSSGNLSVVDQTTNTCYVLDGSSKTDIAGTATIAPGGYATLIRISTTETWLMGSGITA